MMPHGITELQSGFWFADALHAQASELLWLLQEI